jgi:hypothetical protein
MTDLLNNSINLEYDSSSGEYYVVWQPIVCGAGYSASEALEDLRAAAHFITDGLIDLKIKNNAKEETNRLL